jgi:Tfp pilus assembly PilM family ATPase
MCVEYQGRQHFEPVSVFGGIKEFELIRKRDKIKMEYCINNDIPLKIIKYDEIVDYKSVLLPIRSNISSKL